MATADDDRLLPHASLIRARVLMFLPREDKLKAAFINEAWYDAAAHYAAWHIDFRTHGVLGADAVADAALPPPPPPDPSGRAPEPPEGLKSGYACIRDMPYVYQSPFMYSMTLDVASDPTVLPQLVQMLSRAATASPGTKFHEAFALSFSSALNVTGTQMPLANILLRSPRFVALKTMANAPHVYGTTRPYMFIMALMSRWHMLNPLPQNIPWLVSLAHWSAASPPFVVFHKAMLCPLLVPLQRPPTPPLTISAFDVEAIAEAARAMCVRFLKPGVASTSRGDYKECVDVAAAEYAETPVLLADLDPRLIFSVFAWIVRVRPDCVDAVLDKLPYGEYGMAQYHAAARRVEFLQTHPINFTT
jgi:hypothetical protein